MSMIPEEVPFHEVTHDDGGESDPMYPDYWPGLMGHQSRYLLWGNKKAEDEFDEELKRKDSARAKLGGFGFQLPG